MVLAAKRKYKKSKNVDERATKVFIIFILVFVVY